MHMPQWFSSGKVKILEEYHFRRQTLDSSQRFPSPLWLHTPTSHLALRHLLDSQWTGTAHCLTENWSMTKCMNFLQGQGGELAHRGPLSAEADTDVGHFGPERGKKRRLPAKCSSRLWKYTVKQHISPTLLLTVILLQALSCISVATMTLKHWHTLSLCQAQSFCSVLPWNIVCYTQKLTTGSCKIVSQYYCLSQTSIHISKLSFKASIQETPMYIFFIWLHSRKVLNQK